MSRIFVSCVTTLLVAAFAGADEKPAPAEKQMTGMSVVGNDDAPKALVIVPWKSSVLGDTLAVPRSLDDGLQPVDREVFLRELAYYRIRAASGGGSDRSAP